MEECRSSSNLITSFKKPPLKHNRSSTRVLETIAGSSISNCRINDLENYTYLSCITVKKIVSLRSSKRKGTERISDLSIPLLPHIASNSLDQVVMKKDIISRLPDHLICEILNHLPTKQSVKTSVLSTQWRNLWLWVPSLELISSDFSDFDAFVSFGDRLFDSTRVACLQKLKLIIFEDKKRTAKDVSYLIAWMDAAAKCKIQHLNFYSSGNLQVHTNHPRLYKCETLVYLQLFGVTFEDVEFVSLPCLKTMNLQAVFYPNEATFEKLISRCPILEELKIIFYKDDKGFNVHSQSLKRLTLIRELFDFDAVPGVLIDAPLLCSLKILDFSIESVIVNNLESNAKLCISLPFGCGNLDESRRSNIRNFLSGNSKVGDMIIFARTFKRFLQYSKVEPLPQFCFMSRLDANLHASDLKCLPIFLESCPNLKSLILNWHAAKEEMSEMSFSSVPKCL